MHCEDARGIQCLAKESVTEQLQEHQSNLQQAVQVSAASVLRLQHPKQWSSICRCI